MPEQHHGEPDEDRPDQRIPVGQRSDGTPVSLPVERVLTGRAFLTGKSGSGKSNTASVVIEELLDRGFPVAIVDTDGEYYGLKEEYELLHAGADEECDIQVDVEHAEKLATLALEENVPIILDVSGYLDESVASELIRETARHLFTKEKKLKKPFLLVVEEVHEYIPEGGGMDDTGRMLVKVGKRGRKHGLGIVGISQRPADVKKDFITQANWLVWHRLTWNNDTKVVKRIVGSEYGDAVSDLDSGEAFLQADWTDEAVQRVQFRRKRTFDAGATPGLDDFERPDLKSVSDGLMADLSEITEQKERERDRVEELQSELAEKEARIQDLERELKRAQDVSSAAEQMATAVADDLSPESYQARLGAKNDEIDRLHDRIAALEARMEKLAGEDPEPTPLDEFERENGEAEPTDERSDREPESPPPRVPDVGPSEALPEADPEEVAAAVARAAGGRQETDGGDDGEGSDDRRSARETAAGSDDDRGDQRSGSDRSEARSDDDRDDPRSEDHRDDTGSERDGVETGSRDRTTGEPGDETDGRRDGNDDLEARYFTAEDDGPPDRTGSNPFSEYESIESYQDAIADRDGRTPHVDRAGGRFYRSSGRSSDRRDADAVDGSDADPERSAVDADDAGNGRTGGSATAPQSGESDGANEDPVGDLLRADPVAVKLQAAIRGARCNERFAKQILGTLAADGPLTFEDAAEAADVPAENAYSLLSALRARDLVTRDDDHRYALDREGMARIVATAGDGPHRELQEQWNVE